MEPDLQITIKGASEDIAIKVGEAVRSIVCVLGEPKGFLDLRRMHRIIVTSNFAGELAALSGATASGSQITYTREEYAVAAAKVLLLPRAEDYEILPVIDLSFARALANYEEDSESFKTLVHLFHHELCHVHDDNKKIDRFPNVMLREKLYGKEKYIRPLADLAWSEYVANRFSATSAPPPMVTGMANSFKDAILRTKVVIDKEILAYRYHHNLDELLEKFGRHGGFLIQCAAYVLGYMDGLGQSLAEISPTLAECLADSYFAPVWSEFQVVLRQMFETYPDGWDSVCVFEDLADTMEGYYAIMGLFLSTTADRRAYVNVPYTPETTPFLNEDMLNSDAES